MKEFYYGKPQDLEQFGIDLLTGEACGLGTRILCDLHTPGAEMLVRECLGLPCDVKFAEPWNSKGISSFMMPYDLAWTVAVHGMFRFHECDAVAVFGDMPGLRCVHPLVGLRLDRNSEGQEALDEFREKYQGFGFERFIQPKNGPRRGLTMVHTMTGRVA